MEFVSPHMPRRIEGWRSPALGLDMPIVTYGWNGPALLIFPTAAADFLENERFFLIKAIEPAIMAGRVRVFSIDSINKHAWMNRQTPVPEQARRQALYSRYVEEEVVPYIRHVVGDGGARAVTAGASFGAFHSMNALCRRPDLFGGVIAMSGFYDLAPDYFRGYSDDNCYFNNPAWYVPNLEGEALRLLRHHSAIQIFSGQGDYELPEASRRFSAILGGREIPHSLDIWGHDVNHDWPWWRKMLPYALERLGWA